MHYVIIVKTTKHVQDGVTFADIAQEFVSEPFTFAGALNKTGNVNYFHSCGNDVLGFYKFAEFIETLIRNRDSTNVGINSTERKICSLSFCITQAVKQC